jgi:hypothetical protein
MATRSVGMFMKEPVLRVPVAESIALCVDGRAAGGAVAVPTQLRAAPFLMFGPHSSIKLLFFSHRPAHPSRSAVLK